MKRTNIVFGILIVLVAMLIFLSFNVSQQPPERTVIGKGMDGFGNTWLIVSCDSCETERVEVGRLDAYKIGERFP